MMPILGHPQSEDETAPRRAALPPTDMLVRDTAVRESSARSYPLNFPISFSGAEGHYLIGTDGQRYLDLLTGAGVLLLGHNHPAVRQAIEGAALPILSSLDLVTTAKAAFLDSFAGILPEPFRDRAKVHFCGPTGSDAIEAALKLAVMATGRSGIFAFAGGYHGMGQGALAVSSNLKVRRAGLRVRDDVTFLPFPYAFRSRIADAEQLTDYCLDHLRALLEDDHSGVDLPGAMVLEAVQGEGGNIVAPARFLKGLREICDAHGIVLILDEIQSGLGRTGRWFAFEHAGILPDMICVSKGVGGGFPMSLLVYDKAFDCWSPGDHIGTFRGQEFAFRAGRATIETIRDQDLLTAATDQGQRLAEGLRGLANRPGYGEVRGLGLFLGLECRASGSHAAGEIARHLQSALLADRVMIERGGRESSVLRFLPPLTITDAEIERVVEAVDTGFAALPA
jgi:diaminobutyrate-2-oxoglutarate transaminase